MWRKETLCLVSTAMVRAEWRFFRKLNQNLCDAATPPPRPALEETPVPVCIAAVLTAAKRSQPTAEDAVW